jgi:hypothetical protein
VTDLSWQYDGPKLSIEAMARRWRLKLDDPQPGVALWDGQDSGRLLALENVSTIGRRDEHAFDGSSLVSFDCHRGRVQATFVPPAWPGLSVRASWEPTPDQDGFDLEVQVSVTTTAVFRCLEVGIASSWLETPESSPSALDYRVQPRDLQAATHTYDGRESLVRLRRLTTLPIPSTSPHILRPQLSPGDTGIAGKRYVEMVRPNDCARRIVGERDPGDAPTQGALSIQYGLFGHDLEKGVVLRGRIRGIWLTGNASETDIGRHHEAFLREPPSLGP